MMVGLWLLTLPAWTLMAAHGVRLCFLGGDTYPTSRCAPGDMVVPELNALSFGVWLAGLVVLDSLRRTERRRQRRDVPFAAGRTQPGWAYAAVLTAVVIGAHAILFAPTPVQPLGPKQGARIVHLSAHRAYAVNTDARSFVYLAEHPGDLLQPGQVRQSRPGYVVLAATATVLARPVITGLGLDHRYRQRDAAYLAMVGVNFLVLAAAITLFIGLLRRLGVPGPVVAALGVVMMFNEVTRAFLWTPHQQMFGLLTPVLTVLIGARVVRRPPGTRPAALAGLGVGTGLLVYGNFLLTAAVVAALLLWRRNFRPMLAFLGTAALPTLAWMAICIAVTGSYYNHEMHKYHQFVWVLSGDLPFSTGRLDALDRATVLTAAQLFQVTTTLLALLLVLTVAAVLAGIRLAPADPWARAVLTTTAVTFATAVVFLWAMGFWATRITFCLVPLLLIVIAWVGGRLCSWSRAARYATFALLAVCALAWTGFELTAVGPFA